MPRRRQRHCVRVTGLITITGRRSSGGGGSFGATASAARIVLSDINNARVNSSTAMRSADAVAPNLAYLPGERLPTNDIKLPARSKCRRRRRAGALPHATVMLAAGGVSCPVAGVCEQQVMVWPHQAFPRGSKHGKSTVH